jgi:probable addiction module antidote protein
MAKTKTSAERKKSSAPTPVLKIKPGAPIKQFDATKKLVDEDFIAKAVWDCLKDNDPEGVMEILEAHLEAVSRMKLAKDGNIPRATLYHALSSRNPTLRTLAKIVHAAA